MAFSAADAFDGELAREFIDWVCAELADPPAGWEASVEEHQLIVIYTHQESFWRKYPEPGDLMPIGDDWMCTLCTYPRRWWAVRCWWCDQQRGIIDAADADYGYGFRPEVEGAPGRRRADPDPDHLWHADLGHPADPDPESDPEHIADDGDDFARVMGLGS